MNQYEINDNYGYQNYEYLDEVITKVFEHENVHNAICSIIFVDNEEIHQINKERRGVDRATDVISFALEDSPDDFDEFRILGDIFISIPKMQEQAKEYGHSEKRELSFLVVHGLLHLLGYDHMKSKKDEEIMFSLQDEILESLNILR
uniref:rRNA maturation RNase YbeY n=1 Tax=Candidatus Ventrenecus sp. TaxID=3085654 RepID=UPI003FEF522B